MVTSPKPSNDKKDAKNELKDLESEINEVITSCKTIIKNNYNVVKKKQNADTKKKDTDVVTLETVAEDMSNILENLKTHLGTSKLKQDSYSDVIPKLEELIRSSGSAQSKNNKAPPKMKAPVNNAQKRGVASSASKTPRKTNNPNKPNTNANMSKQSVNNTASKSPSVQTVKRQRSNLSKGSISSRRTNTSNVRVHSPSAERRLARPQPGISKEVYDPLGLLKDEVERAKRAEKIFTIRGSFQAVRRALLKRGWIEKYHFCYRDRINEELKKFQHYSIQELLDLVRNKDVADVCKRLIKSKLLASHQVDFYWSYDYDGFRECPDKVKMTKINKIRREGYSFTSKKGLCDASKKSWFQIPGLACMNHPRTYNLVRNGDTSDFIKDFSLTAAMSLLKWIIKNSMTHECKLMSASGKIPLSVFNFAINECYKFIKKSRKEAITDYPEVFEQEWNEFLENYYKIVQFGHHFKQVAGVSEYDMIRKSNYILTHLKEHWAYLEMDGIMNIWILKPINGSQGVGIHICRTLKYILGVIKSNPNRRYIVQKYIERPLLIYNTKFDIRQWFLISSSVPLTIWIYRHSYLRFSSQTYSLRKLHESIHLTNNSVQCRYSKYQKDIALPPYNMWDSTQFKNYLSDIGYPNVFNDIIFPGMKQCITAAVLIHKDKLDRRRNCFELQGADFILTEDFKPWLLEINSSPALHASTPVTARMCPAVLEDVIKVVVDHQRNNKASTGGFELMFDERIHGATLKEQRQAGAPLAKTNQLITHPLHELNNFTDSIQNVPTTSNAVDGEAAEYIKQIGMGLRKTLENLLQILKTEKEKRQLQNNTKLRRPPAEKTKVATPVAKPAEESQSNSSIDTNFDAEEINAQVDQTQFSNVIPFETILEEREELSNTDTHLEINSDTSINGFETVETSIKPVSEVVASTENKKTTGEPLQQRKEHSETNTDKKGSPCSINTKNSSNMNRRNDISTNSKEVAAIGQKKSSTSGSKNSKKKSSKNKDAEKKKKSVRKKKQSQKDEGDRNSNADNLTQGDKKEESTTFNIGGRENPSEKSETEKLLNLSASTKKANMDYGAVDSDQLFLDIFLQAKTSNESNRTVTSEPSSTNNNEINDKKQKSSFKTRMRNLSIKRIVKQSLERIHKRKK